MEWKKDAFGNELKVGDKVIAAVTIVQSPGLRKGTIIKETGKPANEIDWKKYTGVINDRDQCEIEVQKYLIHWDEFSVNDYWNNKEGLKDTVIKGTNLIKINI